LLVVTLLLAACPAPAPAPSEGGAEPAETAAPEAETPAESGGEEATVEDGESNTVVIAPGQNIRIGNAVALTGPIPDPGLDIRQAAEIAIDDLNAAGGVNDFLFELVVEDEACSGDQGTVVANKFAADETIVAVSG